MARQNPCPVPNCLRNKSLTSGYGVCAHHDEIFQAITYYLQQVNKQVAQARRKGVRLGEKVSEHGLILPP